MMTSEQSKKVFEILKTLDGESVDACIEILTDVTEKVRGKSTWMLRETINRDEGIKVAIDG